jgi:hypothetical protein
MTNIKLPFLQIKVNPLFIQAAPLTGAVHSAFSPLSGKKIHQMIPMSQASF